MVGWHGTCFLGPQRDHRSRSMFVLSLATLAFAADPPAEPPTVSATPGRGFTIATADGKFSMNVRGRIMLRETLTAAIPDDAGERDLTLLSQVYTARVYFTGHTLSEDTKYVLQLAVAPNDYRDGT